MAALALITLGDQEDITDVIFNKYCTDGAQGLNLEQIQALHDSIRPGGISLRQVKASLTTVCGDEFESCDREDLLDVLKEMDRRYFLVQDLQWEFALLDRQRKDAISENDAKFLFKMVHGDFFSSRRWSRFLKSRTVPGTDISFSEIEVELCDIPTVDWIEEVLEEEEREKKERQREKEEEERERREAEEREKEEQEAKRRREEEDRKRKDGIQLKKKEEELKRRKDEEEKKLKEKERHLKEEELKKQAEEEERKRKEEEDRRKEEEKRRKQQEEEEHRKQEAILNWKKEELLKQQAAERERLKAEQEERDRQEKENAKLAEEEAENAEEAELRAQEEARKAAELAKQASDEEERKRAEEAEKKALAEAMANKEKRLRMNLKAAVNSKKQIKIKTAVDEAKEAKMQGLQNDIDEAEKVLDFLVAGEKIQDAMSRRHLKDIESSADNIKKKGYQKEYAIELIDAEKLANKLRRLERLRKEILELNQSTISEIRSYQKPLPAIHNVMIAVYMLLGYKENELKIWKNVQALLGKTGKEGLKRQVTTLEVSKINVDVANYTEKTYLQDFDLDTIRDISAGAATFYAWSTSMIEEARAWKADEGNRKLREAEKKKEEEEMKALEEKKKKKQGNSPKATISGTAKASGTKSARPTPGAVQRQQTRGRTMVRENTSAARSKSQQSATKTASPAKGSRSQTPGRT